MAIFSHCQSGNGNFLEVEPSFKGDEIWFTIFSIERDTTFRMSAEDERKFLAFLKEREDRE